MNKPLSIILRCLGFNRPKPKTTVGRYLRRSEHCVTVIGILYLALHIFPQVLFAHSVTVDGITLHAREPIPVAAADSLRQAAALVEASELGGKLDGEHVFVCGSPALLRLFQPRGSGVFGISVPVTDHVFLAAADFESDTAIRFGDNNNTRLLSGLIAHEVTHGLIRKRLGLIRNARLPTWIKEGYCEHVAQDGSFPEDEGRLLFLSGEGHPSPSYRYFVYRLLAGYLLEDRGFRFEDLVGGSLEFDAVQREVRADLRRQEKR